MTANEFKSILLPCYRGMYATAFAVLRNVDDASDAVQDAVSLLWQRHAELAVPDSPDAFARATVRNVCIDRLRKSSKRYFETADAILNMTDDHSTDDCALYNSTMAYIRRVINGFPDKQRRILALKFLSELTNDEICQVTGEEPPNVRQIISRGRLKLKELLNRPI